MEYHFYKSSNDNKKFIVKFLNQTTGRINTINFGANNMSDYTINKDDKRKALYKLRHANDMINDLSYAGAWSWWLLWNNKTLESSIRDMETRFKIKININPM